MRKVRLSVLLLLVIALLVAAMAPVHAAPRERQTTLKMGLLPILDVLPFYVAEQAVLRGEGLDARAIWQRVGAT
jgi:ABC-type nitrate/sulfonate/bicarbonate transport system substrate-binding protein